MITAGATVRTIEGSAELVRTTGISIVEARSAVHLANAPNNVPDLATALAAGEITTGHVVVLSRGVSYLNRPTAAADPSLVGTARCQGVDEFKATVAVFEREANDGLHEFRSPTGERLPSRRVPGRHPLREWTNV